jgi:hypothetical protein
VERKQHVQEVRRGCGMHACKAMQAPMGKYGATVLVCKECEDAGVVTGVADAASKGMEGAVAHGYLWADRHQQALLHCTCRFSREQCLPCFGRFQCACSSCILLLWPLVCLLRSWHLTRCCRCTCLLFAAVPCLQLSDIVSQQPSEAQLMMVRQHKSSVHAA